LGNWLYIQKTRKHGPFKGPQLVTEQLEKLDEIGVDWTISRRRSGNEKFDQMKASPKNCGRTGTIDAIVAPTMDVITFSQDNRGVDVSIHGGGTASYSTLTSTGQAVTGSPTLAPSSTIFDSLDNYFGEETGGVLVNHKESDIAVASRDKTTTTVAGNKRKADGSWKE